jgi:hypothetical protein
VHGPDGDFVHLFSRYLIEPIRLSVRRLDAAAGREVVGSMTPERLERGVLLRNDAALLSDLALEHQ